MMQESQGEGNDLMQAAEGSHGNLSSYCVGLKGSARIGCIKEPNISIEAGVQEFKDVLGKANGDIALALQSYNYGPGFISYALARGGYSEETAIAFSRSMLMKIELGAKIQTILELKSERAMGIILMFLKF